MQTVIENHRVIYVGRGARQLPGKSLLKAEITSLAGAAQDLKLMAA